MWLALKGAVLVPLLLASGLATPARAFALLSGAAAAPAFAHAAFAAVVAGATPQRALLVIDDRSAEASAVAPLAASALLRRGYEVKPLAAPRGEELSQEDARELLAASDATVLVAVTVRYALEPRTRLRGPPAPAALGLTATAWSKERVRWRGSFGGFGDTKDRPLQEMAVGRLFWSFPPAPGAAIVADIAQAGPARTAAPPDYDVRIARLRGTLPGPRFRLKARKKAH